ncbi:MAG: hypothetical protein RLZZ28_1377 [Bacteroidota bacterium]
MDAERDLKWKLLSSRKLFSETWMNIRIDTCEKPDGTVVTPYYVYEFPEWVAALAITADGKVILEKQYRHALGLTCWEIPGGCVDKTDADYETAIKRELLEETGYQFSQLVYLGDTSSNPSTNTNLMHMFLATGGTYLQSQQLDEGEDIDIVLVEMDAFIQMLREDRFIQSMHLAVIYKALEKLGRLSIA